MTLQAKEPEVEFQLPPEGVHQAVCIWIYDLGTQYSEKWDKHSHRVLITWELPNELMEDNKPMVISKEYTLSLHEKAQLRKDLTAWRGKAFTKEELQGFDLHKIVGANCQLQILHATNETRTYANIASIMSLPKGTKIIRPINPTRIYEIGNDIPEGTPEWIIKKINTAQEMSVSTATPPQENTVSEPF